MVQSLFHTVMVEGLEDGDYLTMTSLSGSHVQTDEVEAGMTFLHLLDHTVIVMEVAVYSGEYCTCPLLREMCSSTVERNGDIVEAPHV